LQGLAANFASAPTKVKLRLPLAVCSAFRNSAAVSTSQLQWQHRITSSTGTRSNANLVGFC